MFADAWAQLLGEAKDGRKELACQLKDAEKQIESLLERVIEADSPALIRAYESKFEKLERSKIILSEKLDRIVPPKGQLEKFIELSLRFLSSPWNIYEKGGYPLRQTVLKLAFTEPLRYSRNEGYRTPEISFPFICLRDLSTTRCKMVL